MVFCDAAKAVKFATCPGSRVKKVYSPHVLADGTIELIETGKEDLQDYINSFADYTDLHQIIQRYQQGDIQALNARQPLYGDFTKLPGTLAEYMQLDMDCRTLFESLPAAVRQKFDNDVSKFLASSGSEEWFEKVEPGLSANVREMINQARAAAAVVPDKKESDVTE